VSLHAREEDVRPRWKNNLSSLNDIVAYNNHEKMRGNAKGSDANRLLTVDMVNLLKHVIPGEKYDVKAFFIDGTTSKRLHDLHGLLIKNKATNKLKTIGLSFAYDKKIHRSSVRPMGDDSICSGTPT